MALLGRKTKDPIGELERELATLHGRGELLRQKLIEAQSALESATDARRISLLDADLSDDIFAEPRELAARTIQRVAWVLATSQHIAMTERPDAP